MRGRDGSLDKTCGAGAQWVVRGTVRRPRRCSLPSRFGYEGNGSKRRSMREQGTVTGLCCTPRLQAQGTAP